MPTRALPVAVRIRFRLIAAASTGSLAEPVAVLLLEGNAVLLLLLLLLLLALLFLLRLFLLLLLLLLALLLVRGDHLHHANRVGEGDVITKDRLHGRTWAGQLEWKVPWLRFTICVGLACRIGVFGWRQ